MPKTKQEVTENQQAESQQEDSQEVATSQLKEKAERAAVIYMGPAIAGVAVPGTVFQNGLPPRLAKMSKELPALKRLLVETGKAQQARKDLRNPQSALSVCYQNALEYVKKKGAEG